MTTEEKLNNAVTILNIENNRSKEKGNENMYDYIIPENSYQIRIKGIIFEEELSKMQYRYVYADITSEYYTVIQF